MTIFCAILPFIVHKKRLSEGQGTNLILFTYLPVASVYWSHTAYNQRFRNNEYGSAYSNLTVSFKRISSCVTGVCRTQQGMASRPHMAEADVATRRSRREEAFIIHYNMNCN